MCNRYSRSKREIRIETQSFGTLDLIAEPHFNIAPTHSAPVVFLQDGKLTSRDMTWGWKTKFGPVTNAQAESATKKMFKNAWETGRCLIPADGFYEWKKTGAKPQPYRFVRATRKPFCFAGLYENNCFIIRTGPASGMLRSIHNRAPIILRQSEFDWWLGEIKTLRGGWDVIAREASIATLDCYPVTTELNHVSFQSPQCIEPVVAAQQDLFCFDVDNPALRWRDPDCLPENARFVDLLTTDDSVERGEWTGETFLLHGRPITPLKWRPPGKSNSITLTH